MNYAPSIVTRNISACRDNVILHVMILILILISNIFHTSSLVLNAPTVTELFSFNTKFPFDIAEESGVLIFTMTSECIAQCILHHSSLLLSLVRNELSLTCEDADFFCF